MDFKAGNGLSNKNNLDTEKSFLETLESKYKTTYFWSLFVLLKEEDNSIIFTILGALILFFQLLIFPFHPNINSIWKSEQILNVINYVTQVAEVSHYLKKVQWDVYLIIFYILLFILIFVKANTFYVSYSFSKKKYSFMWPVYTLWAFFSLFSTILFYPILDIFVSVMTCSQAANGTGYVNVFYPSVTCWSGDHILHAVFSIIAALLFLETNFVVSLCYFECKSTANVPNARVNARANFLIILYMTVMIISMMFMRGSDYDYILLIFILGGSLLIFFKFHFNSPYYNERIAKLWSCLMSINLWTAIMLCFAKFMEGTLFEGSIVAWMIGIPFIILIVVTNRDQRVDLLLINVNKFQSGDELQNQIRFILKLIAWQTTNKNASILLDGYIEIHKQTCNKEDCPLKQKAVKTNFNKNKNVAAGTDEVMSDKTNLLIKLLDKMYYYGIKKFPNNTSLRISYAFFLIEKTDSKQSAVHELTTAEQNKPPFDEQFVIFRYRKIIDDELAESKNEGNAGLDAMSEQTFQNHLRQFQANIEKSSMLHMEFWSQLGEDNPDLNKLNELGVKIYHSVNNVEDHWNKLQKISANVPKAMKLYGKFLTDITNDKERGEEFLEKARNLININSNKKSTAINFSGNEEISDNSTPTIFVSGETEKIGIITNINLACSSIFGYTKSELINRNVKILMPPMYSKNHDTYIEQYNTTQEMKFIDKERFVFGKHKSYYVFPVFVNIKPINNGQSVQFAGTFRIDKFFKNISYFITNSSGAIDGITSTCISLLNVDLEMTRKNTNINSYFPNLLDNASNAESAFRATNGGEISYSYKEEEDSKEKITVNLQCYITDLFLSSSTTPVGHIFKFEPKVSTKPLGSRHHRPCTFQFRYNGLKGNIMGEFTDMLVDELLSEGEYGGQTMVENSQFYSQLPFNQEDAKHNKNELQEEKRMDYAEGVRTMYLRDGKVVEAFFDEDEEQKDEDVNNEHRVPGSVNKNNQEVDVPDDIFSIAMFDSTFKTRKQLADILGNEKTPKTIFRLNILGHIIIAFVLALTLTDFFVSNSKFNQIKTNLNLINLSYNRVAEVQNIVAKTRDVFLIQLGIAPYSNLPNASVAVMRDKALTFITSNVSQSTNLIQDIQRQLQLQSTGLIISSRNIELTTTNAILMKAKIGAAKTYDINEATRQVVTMAINLKDSAPTIKDSATADFMANDINWFFITQNCFNDYLVGLLDSSKAYVEDLSTRGDQMNNIFLTFFLIAAIMIFLGITALVPSLWSVNKQKQKILGLFLYLNDESIKNLYTKCEKLISNLQVGEDDDAISEMDDTSIDKGEKGEDGMPDGLLGKRKKNFKTNWKTNKCFLFMIIGFGLILEAYFVFNYYQNRQLMTNLQSLRQEINATSAATSFFYFTANTQSMMFLNYTQPVMGRASEGIVQDNINNMFELDSTIHEQHSINVGIHSESYKTVYNNLMMLDPCSIMSGLKQTYNDPISTEVCKAFASGTLGQGMALGLARHYENMRNMYSMYLQIVAANSTYTDAAIAGCLAKITSSPLASKYNATQQKVMCLMEESAAREIDTMLFIYIRSLFEYLNTQLQNEINQFLDTNISTRLALMITLIVFLFFCYLFLWVPLMGRFKTDFCRTRSMLTMIPKNMIRNTKEIRNYIKKCMSEHNVANY